MELQLIGIALLTSPILRNAGRETTVATNDFASLKPGAPSSVTRTVTLLVVFASVSAVTQTNSPLVGLIVEFPGAPASRPNVRLLGGLSGSVAEFVNIKTAPACKVRSVIAASTGAWFTERTVSRKFVFAAAMPSLTLTVTVTTPKW